MQLLNALALSVVQQQPRPQGHLEAPLAVLAVCKHQPREQALRAGLMVTVRPWPLCRSQECCRACCPKAWTCRRCCSRRCCQHRRNCWRSFKSTSRRLPGPRAGLLLQAAAPTALPQLLVEVPAVSLRPAQHLWQPCSRRRCLHRGSNRQQQTTTMPRRPKGSSSCWRSPHSSSSCWRPRLGCWQLRQAWEQSCSCRLDSDLRACQLHPSSSSSSCSQRLRLMSISPCVAVRLGPLSHSRRPHPACRMQPTCWQSTRSWRSSGGVHLVGSGSSQPLLRHC